MSGERALFLMRQYPRLMQHGTTFTASHTLGWLRGELGLSRQEAQAAVTSTPQLLSCKASESGWQLMTLLSTELGLDKSSTKQVSDVNRAGKGGDFTSGWWERCRCRRGRKWGMHGWGACFTRTTPWENVCVWGGRWKQQGHGHGFAEGAMWGFPR